MRRVAMFAVFAAVLASQPSCSIFESACTKALPSLAQLNVYFDNMQTSIVRAQQAVNLIKNPDVRAQAQQALDVVVASLQAAESLNAAAVSACSQPNAAVIFSEVIKAWRVLEPFLRLLGGDAGSQVPTPLVVADHGGH